MKFRIVPLAVLAVTIGLVIRVIIPDPAQARICDQCAQLPHERATKVAPTATLAVAEATDTEIPWSAPDATPMAGVHKTLNECKASLGSCASGCSRCGQSIYPDCCQSSGGWVACGVPSPCSCPKACN